LTKVQRKSLSTYDEEQVLEASTPYSRQKGPSVEIVHKGITRSFDELEDLERDSTIAEVQTCSAQAPLVPSTTSEESAISSTDAAAEERDVRRSARGPRRRGQRNRLWCHLHLDAAMLQPGFDLVKKIIGRNGCNTREIFEVTRTKVRVRGRGSGHTERDGYEAQVPLMIALAAEHESPDDFRSAFNMAKKLLDDVSQRFERFRGHGRRARNQRPATQSPRYWIGEISESSKECLGELIEGMM